MALRDLGGDETFDQALYTFYGAYLRRRYETIFDFLLARSSCIKKQPERTKILLLSAPGKARQIFRAMDAPVDNFTKGTTHWPSLYTYCGEIIC